MVPYTNRTQLRLHVLGKQAGKQAKIKQRTTPHQIRYDRTAPLVRSGLFPELSLFYRFLERHVISILWTSI